ncbi:DUF6020 family protein [Adlercreutzia caecimuris]|uniref:DUF6020 family protein n=1 Tax=Adlercreutzia caecimuris TaxID=671266 RepID=UPI0013724FF7
MLILLCLSLSAHAFSVYSNLPYPAFIKLLIFILLTASLFCFVREECNALFSCRAAAGFALFSCCASVSFVAGYHIRIDTDNLYGGGIDEIYFSSFSALDVLGFAAIFVAFFLLTSSVYMLLKRFMSSRPCALCCEGGGDCAKRAALACLLLLLLWLPYLFSYWPGLIHGDSLTSIKQIEGSIGLDNHHPVAYTMIVGLFIKTVSFLGLDVTVGCGLYTIAQMFALAYCVAYLSFWCVYHVGLKPFWAYAVIALFATSPYLASFSISMWKDPLFSCGIILLSIKMIELVLSNGRMAVESKSWIVVYALACLAVGFLRSNGVAILVVTTLVACLCLIGRKNALRKALKKSAFIATACLVVVLIVTGPIYNMLGVRSAGSAEALGLPINQVARVVAYDGELSEAEKEALGRAFPFDAYADAYRPLCVDMLKWDSRFDQEAVDGEFLKAWITIGFKNPIRYLEAASLLTAGYWAVNVPQAMSYSRNIEQGHPRNIEPGGEEALDALGIEADNLLGSKLAHDLFPIKTIYGLPLSLINWLVFFLVTCLFIEGRFTYFFGLMPTLGLIATLFLASPIWYWPRYGAAEQILLPVYLVLLAFCLAPRDGDNAKKAVSSQMRETSELIAEKGGLDDKF